MIPKEFHETIELYNFAVKDRQPIDNPFVTEDLGELKDSEDFGLMAVQSEFRKEYNKFLEENKFFTGCPFSLYKSFYDERKREYISMSQDALEIDFIVEELSEISKIKLRYCPEELKKTVEHSINRQREFLIERAKQLDYNIESFEDQSGNSNYTYKKDLPEIVEPPLIDLNDSDLKEKIIYLESLGILDYLKNSTTRGYSTNGLASLLSGILGEKATTIQSYINPMNDPTNRQKNNPMENSKKVLKVKQAILDLGFKPVK